MEEIRKRERTLSSLSMESMKLWWFCRHCNMDARNILKPALARGELYQLVGATPSMNTMCIEKELQP